MIRHIPPAAAPVHPRDMWCGIHALGDPGRAVQNFQTALCEYLGVSHSVPVSSGRAGLYLIFQTLLRLSNRREVIVPAYTCPTVVQAALRAGLRVTFCDVSLDTLGLDRAVLETLVSEEVLAIVAVHPFGLPEYMPDLLALGKKFGIFIIEDAAQALGAGLGDKKVGRMGDLGLLSLGRGKVVTTGEGGVVLTSNPTLAAALQETMFLLFQEKPDGSLGTLLFLASYPLATNPLGWWFIVKTSLNPAKNGGKPPENFRLGSLSTCQAGVGRSMLHAIDKINQVRIRNAELLMENLQELPLLSFPSLVPNAVPIYLRLPVLVKDLKLRERLYHRLHQGEIGVSRMYGLSLPELYPDIEGQEKPRAAGILARQLLTLPTHHLLTQKDRGKILQVFQAELGQ